MAAGSSSAEFVSSDVGATRAADADGELADVGATSFDMLHIGPSPSDIMWSRSSCLVGVSAVACGATCGLREHRFLGFELSISFCRAAIFFAVMREATGAFLFAAILTPDSKVKEHA